MVLAGPVPRSLLCTATPDTTGNLNGEQEPPAPDARFDLRLSATSMPPILTAKERRLRDVSTQWGSKSSSPNPSGLPAREHIAANGLVVIIVLDGAYTPCPRPRVRTHRGLGI